MHLTYITLGSTGIRVPRMAFGALPIQRDDEATAVTILRRAYEGGIRFFDTARAYTDSEKKLGLAFAPLGIRGEVFIASKCYGTTPEEFRQQLGQTLENLRTDYIDIYQFHNPKTVYRPGDGTGMYECMLEAKHQGKIRHIGFTNHSADRAREAVESGLYETLQFPFSYLTGEREMELVRLCREKNVGYIAMKALAGGLITDSRAACAFMCGFDNVLPIWGVQREHELEEFLSYMDEEPSMTPELQSVIDRDRAELQGEFCRSCGYCLPCPAGIEIPTCARMSLLMRRSPYQPYLSEHWQAEMKKIEDCVGCGHCREHCPYGLDTQELLRHNYEDYKKVLAGKVSVQ